MVSSVLKRQVCFATIGSMLEHWKATLKANPGRHQESFCKRPVRIDAQQIDQRLTEWYLEEARTESIVQPCQMLGHD